MPCFKPRDAYRSKVKKSDGKFVISFQPALKDNKAWDPLKIPCQKCLGCRYERSRQWAIRICCEQQTHELSCWITLTYEKMPANNSLNKTDWQKFMKRLRKWIYTHEDKQRKIGYFMAGEYGEQFQRPHFHACIFNFDFLDKEFAGFTKKGQPLYHSTLLDRLWTHGIANVSPLTYENAVYTAKYIMKTMLDEDNIAPAHYNGRLPEFCLMSRNPPLGRDFYLKYRDQVYNNDTFTLSNGKKVRPPKRFDDWFKKNYPQAFEKIKQKRMLAAEKSPENAPYRLREREKNFRIRQQKLMEVKNDTKRIRSV